jgi:Tfp pilus assembly protein PilX
VSRIHLKEGCARAKRVAADDSGVALVMALSVMMVLSILMSSVLFVTSANSRDAQRSNSGIKANALAEAGINNALAVINANYPGTVAYPGDSTILPARTTTYGTGTATWSGSLGAVTGQTWGYEWHVTSTGTVPSPTGAGALTRTMTAALPVTLPSSQQNGGTSPLNWIYAGTDINLSQSLQVGSPVYAVGNLTLSNSAKILGVAGKIGVGGNLTQSTNQNQIGLAGGSDPRIAEAHIVGTCSVKGNVTPHICGGSLAATNWDSDSVMATSTVRSVTGLISHTPSLTCCAPVGGVIAPIGSATLSDMGFWYQNADLGPTHPCTTGSVPFQFDTGDNTINNSVTAVSAINLTPSGSSYSCTSSAGTLSWNNLTKQLSIRGTVFIDGSVTIDATGYTGNPVFTYSGTGTIVASGTFGMKGAKICAVVSGSDCNWSTSAWNPNSNALVVVADGDGGNGGAQGQGGTVGIGFGISIINTSSFQGALIANKAIMTAQTASEQGPMISAYSHVDAGQSGTLTFPAITFAPTAATEIATGTIPTGQLLVPRSFGG